MVDASVNRRLAKNTLFLYFRMFIIMGVTFYTTRVLLQVLGVDDFGIYNTIAGVVVLFAFLNNAMVTTTQRFLNFWLGKEDKERAQVSFSMSLLVHICIGVFVVVLAELLGLWFINNKMSMPIERINATIWTLHLSVAITFVNIVRSPYNACIIAYEKMDFYAYVSIIEAILKLLIVFILTWGHFDKLIFYCLLLFAVSLIIALVYKLYCNKRYEISRFRFKIDRKLFTELFQFSFYSIFGNAANVGAQQGVTLFINAFTNVTVNAAIGVSNQLSQGIYSFISNFQIAFNPVIVKMYAQEDIIGLKKLICRVSKYSYFLMITISLPVLVYAPDFLRLWLKDVPNYTVSFCRLTILFLLIDTIAEPLWKTIQASGNIRKYQMVTSSIILMNLPVAYLLLKCGISPVYIFVAKIVINFIAYLYRALFVKRLINFEIKVYMREVLIPICIITLSLFCIGFLFYRLGINYLISSILMVFFSCLVVFFGGMSSTERKSLVTTVNKRFRV